MKKKIAKWLLSIAGRLDPQAHVENVPVIDNYEAKKIGLTYEITKKDIKEFRFKDGARMSLREAKRGLIYDVRKNIRKHIIGGIDANRLIDFKVEENDGGYRISGE